MTYQELSNRLPELLVQMNSNTFVLFSNQIINEQLDQELAQLTEQVQQQLESAAGSGNRNQLYAKLAIISGLHLWNGSLDRSHAVSQDLETKTGSYLHGILHRMDRDFSNAKYWFRMAGSHPEGDRLLQYTLELLRESSSADQLLLEKWRSQSKWNPVLLTEQIAESLYTSESMNDTALLERIQTMELQLLLEAELRELKIR